MLDAAAKIRADGSSNAARLGDPILMSKGPDAFINIRSLDVPPDLLPVVGPIFAGKFQFSGMTDSGRWTRKSDEEIEVH